MGNRSYRKHRTRRPQSGSGSGGLWGLRLKFTTAKTKVHLSRPEKKYKDPVTGEEEDYLMVTGHFVPSANGGKGGMVWCNDTCVVCAYTDPQAFDLDIEPSESLGKCYPRDQFVVSGWVEAPHHIVEEKGKRDPTKTFKVRRRCEGQKCQYCRDDLPLVFGNRFYHEFSHSAWSNALFEAHTRAGQMCKCGGYVYAVEYKCPECSAVIYDAASICDKCGGKDIGLEVEDGEGDYDAGVWAVCNGCRKKWSLCILDNESLAEDVMEDVRCPECSKVVSMDPVDDCTEEGCKGDPYDVFDCQLTIKKESDQKMSSLVVTDMKIREPDSRLFDPEHQGKDKEQASKYVEEMRSPINLSDLYKKQTSQEQAQLLGVKNPFAPAAGSNVRSYSKDADD